MNILINLCIGVTALVYLLGWIAELRPELSSSALWQLLRRRGLLLGVICHWGVMLVQTTVLSQWPMSLPADLVSGLSWLIMVIYLILRGRLQTRLSHMAVTPYVVLLLLSSALISQTNVDSSDWLSDHPILRIIILAVHIVTLVAGHVLFGFSCVISALFLYHEHQIKAKLVKLITKKMPSLSTLDNVSFRSTLFGFSFLSLGLVLGILLSGQFLNQDNLIRLGISLLVWIMYAIFILERFRKAYQRRFAAVWSIVGFFLVLLSLVIEIYYLRA